MPEQNQVSQLTALAFLAALVLLLFPLSLSGMNNGTARAAGAAEQLKAPVSAARVSPLVGYWQKTNTCAQLVQALTNAGFADQIPDRVGGSGLINGPDNQPLSDPTHPCAQATAPKKHSHFFSSTRQFASFDETGGQVDDGTCTLRNGHTFVMHGDAFKNKIVVHFRVQGETIRFHIVIPAPCTGACRVKMGWAVSALYPGAPFRRVQSP